ncbi:techylectin-5B-like [Limulus polyphemus]|uniref:Techylectin-5B-like n=1 Tax=Limulus polyphemus TaxID=6850 RepID=A0ABM1BZB7_LIMPO|nr:techylectin-5B-like [Limulus polyphemus]
MTAERHRQIPIHHAISSGNTTYREEIHLAVRLYDPKHATSVVKRYLDDDEAIETITTMTWLAQSRGLLVPGFTLAGFSLDDVNDCGKPVNCYDVRRRGFYQSGVYRIWPLYFNKPVQVFCDMLTEGGGWTVLQRREQLESNQDFYLPWNSYKHGFGNLSGEFWIGNELIFALTNEEDMTLRFDLEAFDGEKKYARYTSFLVNSERELYKITVGSYQGTAGDSLSYHNGSHFSTHDRDNDNLPTSCAVSRRGAWWFKECAESHLNGVYEPSGKTLAGEQGVYWQHFRNDPKFSLKRSEMKIRPEF